LQSLLDPGFDPIFLLCQLKLVKETNDLLGMSIVRYYGGQNRLFSLLRLSIAREVEATRMCCLLSHHSCLLHSR